MGKNYYVIMVICSWLIVLPYWIYWAFKRSKVLELKNNNVKEDVKRVDIAISIAVKYVFTCVAIILYLLSFIGMQLCISKVNKDGLFKTYVIDTGLFTVAWLIVVGLLIRRVSEIYTKKAFKAFYNPEAKNPYWVVAFIFSTVTLFFQDLILGLTMLGLLLGKFIWVDFLSGITKVKIKETISRENLKKVIGEIKAKIILGEINFEVIFNETIFMIVVLVAAAALKKYEAMSGMTVFIVVIFACVVTLIGNKLLTMYRKRKRKLYDFLTLSSPGGM